MSDCKISFVFVVWREFFLFFFCFFFFILNWFFFETNVITLYIYGTILLKEFRFQWIKSIGNWMRKKNNNHRYNLFSEEVQYRQCSTEKKHSIYIYTYINLDFVAFSIYEIRNKHNNSRDRDAKIQNSNPGIWQTFVRWNSINNRAGIQRETHKKRETSWNTFEPSPNRFSMRTTSEM